MKQNPMVSTNAFVMRREKRERREEKKEEETEKRERKENNFVKKEKALKAF